MRYLLDTHIFLRAAADPHKLPDSVIAVIKDTLNEVYLSAVAAWEIDIKYALKKLPLPIEPATFVPSRMRTLGFLELPLRTQHALAVSSLPNHHTDPFDRVMLAQAQVEGMTFVTADKLVLKYPCLLLDAR
ncbi:MAG: type II toxin-antitoxin system VapC family toxin [Candidatus Eremiobacteraeota bacterium]|nr:type II toxin-antitoxin system VapC family toxin [Candidatus Eremiobacteraeota bacterium]